MDKIYINRLKTIDSVAATSGIIEYIKGCKLLVDNEVVYLDHYTYVFDIALEDYFDKYLDNWDQVNRVMLNPSRRSYREIFLKVLEN